MTAEIDIRNVGGIHRGSATITEGPNAVRATNWQGKSSFISAIAAVMGVGEPLTEGRSSGDVELRLDDERYYVELTRDGSHVRRNGDCYLTEKSARVKADLFAFLAEDNEVRRAVRSDENLEEVLTRPLDFENIDEQIASLTRERDEVESELERAKEAASDLPGVQETVTQLETRLDTLRAKRAELETGEDEYINLEDKQQELGNLRAESRRVDQRIERLESSIERTEERLEEARDELASHEIPEASADAALQEKREEVERLERDADLLQSLYSANNRFLEADRLGLLGEIEHGLIDDSISCWVCGNGADEATIEAQLETIADRISEIQEQVDAEREELEELESRETAREKAKRRQRNLEQKVEDLESKLADQTQSLDSARDRRGELDDEIERLAEEVEDINDQVSDIEGEIKFAEQELAEAREELETLQSRANRRETLQSERDALSEEIADLRDRKESVKRSMRETFNDSVSEIAERFETGFESARLTSNFELVVARDSREASIETLSEGEREILGVVAALAGYEAYDVAETVPFILLDELGGFADDNLHLLVEYFRDQADYLVFTAYPENTDFGGNTVSLDEWDIVSDRQPASD